MLPKVAISAGDPAGVGPELALRALTEPHVLAACHPIVFADLSVLTEVSGHLNRPLPACPTLSLNDWEQRASTLNQPAIVDLRKLAAGTVAPGKVTADTGAAAYSYIVAATHAALKHQVAGIVTAPIHKEAFHAAGVAHPGHTELLAELTNCHRYCMMLTSREISCSLVTCHIGLRD
ncbi:MAG: 4-hydroxythreonine-4-phosphate dehydrogenase PdxA, partial [Planctomycetales bacterium]|nr:4-hydroxythreonine-4-phosphate dehydrogenase PdxA [Planctomycetales bacterium]